MNKGKAVFNNYNCENECNYSAKKRNKNKNDSLEDINFDSNRDTSPYRIENFLDVLHKFGISNTSIMKKLMNTPMAHINFGKELVNDMQQDISHLLVQKNKQKLPTIKSVDEYPPSRLKWNLNMNTAKAEESKNIKNCDNTNSQANDNDIQLPNLNASQSKCGSKYSSPYRQPINNRRNLSIKQSWDKPRIFNKNNLVNNQIGKEHKKVEFENKHLAKKQDKTELNSPKVNVMELNEAQEIESNYKNSNYYGKYVKETDSV